MIETLHTMKKITGEPYETLLDMDWVDFLTFQLAEVNIQQRQQRENQ